jgi:hypothetical protein
MEHSCTWEADSLLASAEIPAFHWTSHKRAESIPHSHTKFKIHFNIIVPAMTKWSLPFRFSNENVSF